MALHPRAAKKMSTFLNRLLALPMADQATLFEYFSATMDAIVESAKAKGAPAILPPAAAACANARPLACAARLHPACGHAWTASASSHVPKISLNMPKGLSESHMLCPAVLELSGVRGLHASSGAHT